MKLKSRNTQFPFASEAGKQAYLKFLNDGPLARIFSNDSMRLAPAKGSKKYRNSIQNYPNLYEQTYFAHALNVSTTAGILFETVCSLDSNNAPTEREIRMVLAAGALHDFNKLPQSNKKTLERGLIDYRDEAISIISEYIDESDFDSVLHLALDTESTTSKDSSSYALSLSPRKASKAALSLQLADQLVGSNINPASPETYLEVLRKFQDKHSDFKESFVVNVQTFAFVPQPLLARKARNVFINWIRNNGTLLHESEGYVTWIGPKPSEDDFKKMDTDLGTDIKPSSKEAFDKAGYKHNSFGTAWVKFIEPTPDIVDQWIEYFGGHLVFWQGNWGIQHFNQLSKDFPGIFMFDKPSTQNPNGRVRLELPEEKDESAGQEYQMRYITAKLIIAHCVMQNLQKENKGNQQRLLSIDNGPYNINELDGVMGVTVSGILNARSEHNKVKESYNNALQNISQLLKKSSPITTKPVEGYLGYLLGTNTEMPKSGQTGDACVYCGKCSQITIRSENVFGIKPTAWAPRKKGIQRENQGNICDLCVVENQLRNSAANESQAIMGKDDFLSVHVHAADLVCDVYWAGLKPLLQSERADSKMQTLVLYPKAARNNATSKGQIVPIRSHYSLPIPKPAGSKTTSETLVYLYRLRDSLSFIYQTGFKLHVSTIALIPAQQKAQFKWDNSPAWMNALGLDEIHVDELLPTYNENCRIPSALETVDALIKAGYAVSGSQGHRVLISQLIRNPLSLYQAAGDKIRAERIDSDYISILEDRYMNKNETNSIEKIALAYIRFNAKGEWSNNTWTWATRQYLELRDRYQSQPDWISLLKGDLIASAQRKNKGAKAEDIEEYVEALETYLAQYIDGNSPIGTDQRVLINAIAYKCKQNYRKVFPKEVST
jgi:hypothetical protein